MAGVIIALMLGGLPASRARADSSAPLVTATVYGTGPGEPASVSVAALQADPTDCPTYVPTEMTENRAPPLPQYVEPLAPNIADDDDQGEWPLESILACLTPSVSVTSVREVEILGLDDLPENGLNSIISQQDLYPQFMDFQGGQVPVIGDFGTYDEYDRPPRSAADYDYNDRVQEPNGMPVSIEVFESGLKVTITSPTQTSIDPGTKVTFTASVDGAAGVPTDSWDFDGAAAPSSSTSPQVAFDDSGTYTVTLTATDSDGDRGSAQTVITVGPQSQTTPSTPTTPLAASPGPGSSGGTGTSGPAVSTGTISGTSAGTQTVSGASAAPIVVGNHPTSAGGSTRGSTVATTVRSPTISSSTATRDGVPATGNRSTPGSGATDHGAAGRASTQARPTAAPGDAPTSTRGHQVSRTPDTPLMRRHSASSSRLISGLLVGDVDVSPASAATPALQAGASAHAPALAPAGHVSSVAGVAAGTGVLVLLGLGVGQELRGRRWRDRRNRPRTA